MDKDLRKTIIRLTRAFLVIGSCLLVTAGCDMIDSSGCAQSETFVATSGPTPSLSISDASIVEGNGPGTKSLNFRVTKSNLSNKKINVQYAFGAPANTLGNFVALGGVDYTETPAILTIAASAIASTITVPIIGDTAIEADERFTLTLSNPTNATIARATGIGTILNDDILLNVTNVAMAEGNAGFANMVFTVTMNAPTPYVVEVFYATSDGTATQGTDYTLTKNKLSIFPPTTSGTINIPIVGDTVPELDETFSLTLSNPANAVLDVGSVATGTIQNDDAPYPSLSVAAASVQEGNGPITTPLSFPVSLSAPSIHDISVNYTISDGTAKAITDYVDAPGTLTILAGNPTGTITVQVVGDTNVEPDETLMLTLSGPVNVTLATPSVTGTILNDDGLGGSPVAFIEPVVGLSEGSGVGTTALNFTVNLSSIAPAGGVSVNYSTADGTATVADNDYTAVANALLTIPAGQPSGLIPVLITKDNVFEANETFTVTISNPVGGTIGNAVSTAHIGNDDPGGLNDTGITTWADNSVSNLTTAPPLFPGQDADSGWDSIPNTNPFAVFDGNAGFSFTKLDAAGAVIADQTIPYATTPWSCVRDEHTGLTWETKTVAGAGGLQDPNHSYSWFNSTGINDGGVPGTANGGVCVDAINCDTEKYVAAVNAVALCGFTDWRLPDIEELISFFDYTVLVAGVDAVFFPNDPFAPWSSTTTSISTDRAYTTNGYRIDPNAFKWGRASVRLVRGIPNY